MDRPTPSTALVGTTATTTFTVESAQTTTVFGRQEHPPGRPAATDSAPSESVRVLGTAPLLSQVEFTGRESIEGKIPPGTGVVGKRASVSHLGAATVGTQVRVRTEVVAVEGAEIVYDGRVMTVEEGRAVADAEVVFQLVDRDRFRRRVGDDEGAESETEPSDDGAGG